MKVKELIERLQKLNCDERQVVIEWNEHIRKFISSKHNDFILTEFGLTFIPIGVGIDNYVNETGDILIHVQLEEVEK